MHFGILVYENTWYPGKSSNIGDYVQTLAQINMYREIICNHYGVDVSYDEFFDCVLKGSYRDFTFVFVPRDNLSEASRKYPDKKIHVIMNGWFMHACNKNKDIDWPPPENIVPLFISFHVANEKLLDKRYVEYYKKHEPIGCRDKATLKRFQELGVNAYFSGCLTTTIDFLKWDPKIEKTAVVDVKINPKNVSYEFDSYDHMICKDWDAAKSLPASYNLLKKYTSYQEVVTSRLHAYLPCTSIGIPTTFVSPRGNAKETTWGSPNRFDGLRKLSDRNKLLQVRSKLIENIINGIKIT